MFTFRPFDFSDQDYATCLALHHAVWPDEPTDIAHFKHQDKIRPKSQYWHRIIAERDGQPLAYGVFYEARNLADPNQYGISWLTPPKHRRQGLASAFYEFALARLAEDGRVADKFYAHTREDKPEAIACLTKHGFEQKNRYPRSELQLDQFDLAPLADYPARIASHGLKVKSLAEIIPNDPDWQRKLYDLEWVFEQDEPTEIEATQQPFDEFVREELEDPDFHTELQFIALDGTRFAGLSSLWTDSQQPHILHTGWTGVDRPYRKKGLAIAMKLAAIAKAQSMPEVTTLRTDNHETNWMYQINLRLGFKPLPADLSFEKTF